MSRSLRISRSRIATFACSKSPSLTQVPANPVAEITRPKPFSARIRTKRSPRCAHIIVPAASFLAISRLQRRAQGRFRCLARLLRGSAKIRAPNQRRPAPTRIESLTPPLLLHHQHSSLIPTPASRLPVAKARAKLLRLLQFCAVAAKPVSADPSLFCFPRSRPLFRRILSPSLSLPFPSSTSLDSIPLKTPKGELASTAILNPRLPPSRVVRTSFTPTTHHLNARTSFLSSSPLQFARATASRPRLNPLLPTSFSPQG